MRFRFHYRRYRLPFRAVVRTGHGPWAEREGLIVRLEDVSESGAGAVGYGEAAPIPWFGTETVDEDEEAARALGEWIEGDVLERVPLRCGCLRAAIADALALLAEKGEGRTEKDSERAEVSGPSSLVVGPAYLGVAGLLPAGRAVLEAIPRRAEMGFRVFKWKVGVGDIADELSLLDDVCAALPDKAKLRLDANGVWERRQAERWLERCAERPVEYVEQPCFAEAAQGAARQRKVEDVLLGLAGDFPTPLALDESLVGDGDVERWVGMGWPGVFVVKPALLGDAAAALARLEKAQADVVFSSALETAVGARAALRRAFAWQTKRERRALGFGVWPLFQDMRFDGPGVAPFVRAEDLARMEPEAIWSALS